MSDFFISFKVKMQPVGKARPRVVSRFGHTHAFTPKKTTEAENKIKAAAIQALQDYKQEKTDIPLSLRILAYFALPKSATKKRRQEIVCKPNTSHTQKPDIDNIVKLVSDALNDVVYFDDKQIAEVIASKYWTVEEPCLIVSVSGKYPN